MLFLVFFICGYVCAFLFVLFSIVFFRKSCLAVCVFFVLSAVLFFVPVFGSLCFFCVFAVFLLLACLLV